MTFLAPASTPGTYEYQVADQLHDPNQERWSAAQLDQYINEARKQTVMDTGCLRTLQQSYVTGGTEQYQFGQVMGGAILAPGSGYVTPVVTFSGGGGSGAVAVLTQSGGAVNTLSFSNFGSGYTSAPIASVTDTGGGTGATVQVGICSILTYDILGIHLLWGTERYSLQWYPFRQFSAWLRPFTAASYQRQPVAWAVYGDNALFVGPTPDQSYPIEIDSAILPTPFATGDTTTPDAIPAMCQDPIKFYAAYLAKSNAQNYGEAQKKLDEYQRRVREVVAVYTGRLPDVYGP